MSEGVAVFVDGDNIGAIHAPRIMAEAARLGRIDIARAYADVVSHPGWLSVAGLRPVHAGSGKNASDMLMCIDAMEMATARHVASVVIVTSDGDFSHLARRLRETGRTVLGIGEAKAPERFRAACSRFLCLTPVAVPDAPVAEVVPAPVAVPHGPDLDLAIRSMIARDSRKGEGVRITDLSLKMRHEHGVQISSLPEKTWRRYFEARGALFELDPKGTEAKVRFIPAGFRALDAAAQG